MENPNITPLLIRPNPQKNESWRGYVLRVSEENALLSPRTMLRHSQVSEKNLKTAFPHINNMCALTLKPETALQHIYPINLKNKSFKILRQSIPKAYLRVNKPVLCTECVRELGYIPARWYVVYMQVCHKHKKIFIDQCPSCNSKFKWYRQGLLKCHCSYDFSDFVGSSASDEEVNFSELLSHVIESEPSVISNEKNIIPASFFNMSLRALLGVFNTLGLAKLDLDGKTKLNMPFGSADVYSEGVQILNNWPSSFQKIIHINERKYGKNLLSIRKRHENLYKSIFTKGYPGNEISFVRDDFVKFAQSTDVPVYVDKRIKNKVNIN